MNELINVIDYLQGNDTNGNYNDIIQEIEDGLLTHEEAKKECITILKRWQSEEISPNDTKEYNRLKDLIDTLY